MSSSAFSIAAMARWFTPFGACTCFTYRKEAIDWMGRGSWPISASAMPWMTAVRPRLPSASVYSDQPTIPSSVVTFRNEKVRQPASQCRSSIRAIFMVGFLRIYLGPRPGYRGLRAEQPEAGYIGAMNMLLSPLIRALSQFDDPIFLGVLARSVAWSIACFIALH